MAERYIPEHRRTQFKAKNQFRPDELRRRREEQQIEIRKQKREEGLAKRRGIVTRDGGIGVGGSLAAATESDDEASAIESEVGFTGFTFLPPLFRPRRVGPCVAGFYDRRGLEPSFFSDSSTVALCPHYLCLYDAIINMEFFSPPGCYGANPSNPGHYYTRPHYASL
jgi:hypothetical protein